MNTVTEPNHFTADDERMLLDAIDNRVEKSVRPIAREYDHADKYPTKPDCGTDLQAIRTVAKKNGHHYVNKGNKIWITNSGNGGAIYVRRLRKPICTPTIRSIAMTRAQCI